jgi:hypothetical protein
MNDEYVIIDKKEYENLIKLKTKYSKDTKSNVKNIKINQASIDLTSNDLADIKEIVIEEIKNDLKKQIKVQFLESDEEYLYSDGSDYEA